MVKKYLTVRLRSIEPIYRMGYPFLIYRKSRVEMIGKASTTAFILPFQGIGSNQSEPVSEAAAKYFSVFVAVFLLWLKNKSG